MVRVPWNIFDGWHSQESSRKVRNEVFCRFGSPKNIVSDNRSHFVNNTLRRLCKEWYIRQDLLSPYHSCPNRVERTNADLVRIIASYLSDCNGKWDFHIHNFLLVLRSMIKDTTQVSPALVNLGRKIQLPKDRCLKKIMPRLFTSSSFVS
jgi:transposase InsO family protein